MSDKYYLESIVDAIGNTPLVKLKRIPREYGIKGTVLVKPEYMNPGLSVKDRMVVYCLQQAIKRGELKPGGTIVEATSGNTGAAVAMFAAANGYQAVLTIPDKMSREKVDSLTAYGAKVHICPTAVPPTSPDSYYETANRIKAETPNSYMISQYHNKDNIDAHYNLTGPEIWNQTNGGQFDIFVGGIGTGGTVSGTAKFLKEKKPSIEIVAIDIEGSVYYDYFHSKKLIEGVPYKVEGIGDDMLCETVDFSVLDYCYRVTDKESFAMARQLALKEGLMVGGSSGSAVAGAFQHAKNMTEDKTMVIILPDSGVKYISKQFSDQWMRENKFLD